MLAVQSSALCLLLCLSFARADISTVFNRTESIKIETMFIYNSLLTILTHESSQKYNISHTIVGSQNITNWCQIRLDKNLYKVSVHPFTANKAILVAQTTEKSEEQYAKYTIVSFPDCKTTDVKINFGSFYDVLDNLEKNRLAILINEDNTFDILYCSDGGELCDNKVSRMTLDAQGNKVNGPIAFFIPVPRTRISSIKKIPSTSHFIVTELVDVETYKISLRKPDEQVVLKEFKQQAFGDWKDHDILTSYGMIRFCRKTDTAKVDCEIFDNNGNRTSKITVDASHEVSIVTIKNLENGEFLLLTEDYSNATVMKVKGDGLVIGVVQLPLFPRKHDWNDESYIDMSNDQYCVTRANHFYKNMRIVKECFDDSDFH